MLDALADLYGLIADGLRGDSRWQIVLAIVFVALIAGGVLLLASFA